MCERAADQRDGPDEARRPLIRRPGLEADLIVVKRDPTADIEAVRDVLLVVNNGKVAVNRLYR